MSRGKGVMILVILSNVLNSVWSISQETHVGGETGPINDSTVTLQETLDGLLEPTAPYIVEDVAVQELPYLKKPKINTALMSATEPISVFYNTTRRPTTKPFHEALTTLLHTSIPLQDSAVEYHGADHLNRATSTSYTATNTTPHHSFAYRLSNSSLDHTNTITNYSQVTFSFSPPVITELVNKTDGLEYNTTELLHDGTSLPRIANSSSNYPTISVDGTVVFENGIVFLENDTVYFENGTVFLANGTVFSQNSSVIFERGAVLLVNDTVVIRNGTGSFINGTFYPDPILTKVTQNIDSGEPNRLVYYLGLIILFIGGYLVCFCLCTSPEQKAARKLGSQAAKPEDKDRFELLKFNKLKSLGTVDEDRVPIIPPEPEESDTESRRMLQVDVQVHSPPRTVR